MAAAKLFLTQTQCLKSSFHGRYPNRQLKAFNSMHKINLTAVEYTSKGEGEGFRIVGQGGQVAEKNGERSIGRGCEEGMRIKGLVRSLGVREVFLCWFSHHPSTS